MGWPWCYAVANNLCILIKKAAYIPALVVAALALLLASCEKDITVDLPAPEDAIIVEGYIFEGHRPYIMLSRNAAYFSPIDSVTLAQSVIYDATVTVSDGTITDTLVFQKANEAPLKYAYVNSSPALIGQAGKTYTLTIITNGKTLTSTTTIVPSVPIDSLHWQVYEDPGDTLGLIWTYFKDPGTTEHCYRIFSRRVSSIPGRNQRTFRPNTLLSNNFFFGQNYSFGVGQGDKYGDGLSEDKYDHADYKRYRIGDTVKVRLCAADLVTYNFVRVLEQSMDDANSPFASPYNVPTNIQGGLGCWQGYGVTEVQVVCQP